MLSDQVYYVDGYGGPCCGSYIVLTCTEDDYRRGWIDCVYVRKVRQDREHRLYVRLGGRKWYVLRDPNVREYPEKCAYGTCALEAADGGD